MAIITGPMTRAAAEASADRARRQLGQGWRVTIRETPDLITPFVIDCRPDSHPLDRG